jgi:hypothetical protein
VSCAAGLAGKGEMMLGWAVLSRPGSWLGWAEVLSLAFEFEIEWPIQIRIPPN